MVRTLKAGLLALTILATSAPALAQPGAWNGGHGGGGGGAQRQPGGGGNHGGGGGQPGGGAPAPHVQAPQPQAPAPSRNWGGNGNGGGNGGGNRQWQGQRPQAPAFQPAAPARPSGAFQNQAPNNNWNRGNGQWNNRPAPAPNFGRPNFARPDAGRPAFGNPGFNRPGNNWQDGPHINNAERWRDQRRWTNDWRRDSRYDWNRYRQSYRDYYHLPAYRAPVGWGYGYSSFGIGAYLGSPLFASDYWIDDPYSYRLPPAYGTLRWVRYYDDALLVDIRDGYVVDVIHDFFW